MEEQAQQIYSLSPLATWVPTRKRSYGSKEQYAKCTQLTYDLQISRREESNPRPAVYKTAALPAELRRHEYLTKK